MRAYPSGACLIVLGLLAGCGGQGPAAPSAIPSGLTASAMESIVAAAVSKAAVNSAIAVSPDGLSRTITVPCDNGGSISVTSTSTGVLTSSTFTSSTRTEFNDCRAQTVTINGDPAIVMDGTYTFERAPGGAVSSLSATTRMTGGVRFDVAGTSGRARYDCTMTMSMQIGSDGTPTQPTMTSSGTITWEQPLGRVVVRSCGG